VAVQTKPLTLPPFQTSKADPADKKRKRDPKSKEVVEEDDEGHPLKTLSPRREPRWLRLAS